MQRSVLDSFQSVFSMPPHEEELREGNNILCAIKCNAKKKREGTMRGKGNVISSSQSQSSHCG